MNKCKELAKTSVYWPSIMRDIEQLVGACAMCLKFMADQRKEPMIPHEIPNTPWTKVGSDILEFQGTCYLIDYTSKYQEVCCMGKSKTASTVIAKLKTILARFGIPSELIADNMPYGSYEMREFAHRWEFKVTTSSATYSQSNGKAEATVKLVKRILSKALHDKIMDLELTLLRYRNTPVVGCPCSPAEILMSKQLRETLPTRPDQLAPCVVDAQPYLKAEQE